MSVTHFAQESKVEEKLERLRSSKDVKVTEVEKDIIKIEYPSGKTKVKNIAEYVQTETTLNKSATFETTTINLRTIDTTLYHQKYKFWQEVSISSDSDPVVIADVNRNGFPEIYGIQKEYYGNYSGVTVMEINEQGKFKKVFSYDSTLAIKSIYDVDKDGKEEVSVLKLFIDVKPDTNDYNSWWQYPYFTKVSDTSLATEYSFVFEPKKKGGQQEDHRYGDWDGDNKTDMILNILEQGVNIYEYNSACNNFDSLYYYDYDPLNFYYRGFAQGDFDEDGKMEFFAGSIQGKIVAIENRGDNDYGLSWEGMVETYNAYLFTQTNDLDGNGKKEIWAGGDATYDGVGITRITLFESDGNDSYTVVGRIDLVGVFSFWAGNFQTVDVDKDGIEEVLICIDGHVLILKFNGSLNHQTYEVFYLKQNELALNGRSANYIGATLYDLIDDDREEVIINMIEGKQNVGPRLFSYTYKPDFILGVEDRDITLPSEYRLHQNFPNPFNPTTTIRYNVPQRSLVKITVYNVLGAVVERLVEEEKAAGSYSVIFDAKQLPSGIYIINMNAGSFNKSIKTILLK